VQGVSAPSLVCPASTGQQCALPGCALRVPTVDGGPRRVRTPLVSNARCLVVPRCEPSFRAGPGCVQSVSAVLGVSSLHWSAVLVAWLCLDGEPSLRAGPGCVHSVSAVLGGSGLPWSTVRLRLFV